jgi:hypothetical protein
MEMLEAGDAYRAGYGAVLRAPRDIPSPDAVTPPVLITAYDGDPLQAHINRLGAMPAGWSAGRVASPAEHHARSLAFLMRLPHEPLCSLQQDDDDGFYPVTTAAFDGLIHVHGGEADLPGHGLSDPWPDAPPIQWPAWQMVIDELAARHGVHVALPPLPKGDIAFLYPDLIPDRFGTHLVKAWGIARARALFEPWYQAREATALPVDPALLDPAALARATLSILRDHAAKAFHIARTGEERWG